MSFDLRFVSRGGKPAPAMSTLTKWAKTQRNIVAEKKGESETLAYENSETGVYFTLYRAPESLDLNINYCRPTFFAIEAAEVLDALAKEFSLIVTDPRVNAENTDYKADSLIAWWKDGNKFACAALASMEKDLWMEEGKATDLWRYLRNRQHIKQEYADYFVPEVLVVQLDNKVVRGAHLTKPTWYVMPPVDVFWLENRNIVRAERVLSVLKPYLTKLKGFDWLNVIHEDTTFDTDVMDVWESMYDALTPDFNMSQLKDKLVAMDKFVDVRP